MGRRKDRGRDGPILWEQEDRRLVRRLRRQRALFIPRFLREAAASLLLQGEAQDQAYQLAVRWAELETNGHLPKYKETSIDTQFLDQLFGEGLGYRVKTTSPDAWQLEHKYSVQDVGTADAALGDFPKTQVPRVVRFTEPGWETGLPPGRDRAPHRGGQTNRQSAEGCR